MEYTIHILSTDTNAFSIIAGCMRMMIHGVQAAFNESKQKKVIYFYFFYRGREFQLTIDWPREPIRNVLVPNTSIQWHCPISVSRMWRVRQVDGEPFLAKRENLTASFCYLGRATVDRHIRLAYVINLLRHCEWALTLCAHWENPAIGKYNTAIDIIKCKSLLQQCVYDC